MFELAVISSAASFLETNNVHTSKYFCAWGIFFYYWHL